VLSMAIRQIRHLSEKPFDFFRLPIFIIVSTAFLMPIRLIGFFRMGHASGWGTRAGAYGGGASNDDLMDELTSADLPAAPPGGDAMLPTPVLVDTASTNASGLEALGLQPASVAGAAPSAVVETSPRRASAARAAAPKAQKRRRLNPKAAWPYVIGIAIFAIEGYFVVIN